MPRKIILTSFQTWLPHQTSNSSDDLLSQLPKHRFSDRYSILLRGLPVDPQKASKRVLLGIEVLKPDAIICCGMAESRSHLTIESNAECGSRKLKTTVHLAALIADIPRITISHDAGKFVCEALYYEVLNYIEVKQLPIACIFVHVPLLNSSNIRQTIEDFLAIIERI
ncbi:peptidase C15 [Oscillatoria sp. FACHB-1406]|uniref:pyroglutamyl-peptidase I family protein n=1 Tax=Oscillatoria sp. FACHB-1406 TaxID=2692846 RepID=UPI0016876600|nr:peptidase C15 [Oscillatoria sp. FACHB-1406]MBD2577544.1 peptidase C15 [Oscillatoria sp. FACHB-1406]